MQQADWRELVKAARKDTTLLSDIFRLLEPTLTTICRRMGVADPDDPLQAAREAIWKRLGRARLSRSDREVRAWLIRVGINAMRDNLRRQRRQARGECEAQDDGLPAMAMPAASRETGFHFGGLLRRYLQYVRATGAMAGAHQTIARRRGVSLAKQTAEFHKAARKFSEVNGLASRPKRFAGIISLIMGGK
jgi:hypothetical protein